MENCTNMNIIQLRKKIHRVIDHADERFLRMVEAISNEYAINPIGYDADGNPIDKEKLRQKVLAVSKRVKSGDYIAQEEIEKEIKNW